MPRKRVKRKAIPDRVLYAMCELFLQVDDKKWNAVSLAKWLTDQGYERNPQEVVPLLRQGIERGFLRLCPPRNMAAENRLSILFPQLPPDTKILDVGPPFVGENLAAEAADLVLTLIKALGPRKQRQFESGKAPSPRVHVGLGAGDTTRLVTQKLALRIALEPDLPPMTFHALSSGFGTTRPLSAPVAFFSSLSAANRDAELVGLFSAPFARTEDYESLKALPSVGESFLEAAKIDIVITSLAQAEDEHGLLNSFLAHNQGGKPQALRQAGHVGDVMWQPFSDEGPLSIDTGIRAVTLFDLPDLVRLASTPDKHVILVAGPCNVCGTSKAKALRPLLTQPGLRVCNHLLTDVATVSELLRE